MRTKYCILLLLVSFSAWSQALSTKSKRAIELYLQADNYRVRGQYEQAESMLREAIKVDKNFEEAYFRLAQVLDRKENSEGAIQNLEAGRALAQANKWPVYEYELARLYLRKGDYQRSLSMGESFLTHPGNASQAQQMKVWVSQCRFALENMTGPATINARSLSDTVNCFPMQYFPVLSVDENTLVFTMRTGRGNQDDENLVISQKVKGRWQKPEPLSPTINTSYREGTCSISADGRHIVFARCGPSGCDLFESFKVGNDWSDAYNLGSAINSAGWEVQPSLSSDGRELYFVSDRKGGYGGYDIWVSSKDQNNIWQPARNAGRNVNTPYDEISPQLHASGLILYFASNGRPGFGGQDLYFANRQFQKPWSEPVNLGYPLNDHAEQFAFFISRTGRDAFYTVSGSTRKDGSRIFRASLPENIRPAARSIMVSGLVRDKTSKLPLGATVALADLISQQVIAEYESDSVTGEYLFVLPDAGDYAVHVHKKGYLFESLHFAVGPNDPDVRQDCWLSPIASKSGTTLNNVFFETNSYALSEKSKTELSQLAQFLRDNPEIAIEIQGHTDNVGQESYNQELSLKRAGSVKQHLLADGIQENRVFVAGFGSKRPVLPNTSAQSRAKNRRIEIFIR
ncbi:MAG: OmpA family protein [Cyclobacteriaceae bacterium]